MRRVLLCSGVLLREGALLLVASRYPNHRQPLWNLPGGRVREGELLCDALVREFCEETELVATVGGLLYISESHDAVSQTHFLNATFAVTAEGEPRLPEADAHVVAFAWVPRDEVAARLAVRVVREPLAAWLSGSERRYYGFADAGITIEFADEP